MEMRSSRE